MDVISSHVSLRMANKPTGLRLENSIHFDLALSGTNTHNPQPPIGLHPTDGTRRE